MVTYIFKRILLFIPTLIAISLITFGIAHLAPGDPAENKVAQGESQRADRQMSIEQIKRLRAMWHLDEPLHKQYFLWVGDLVTLNFGRSFKDNGPVIDKIMERIPITVSMNLVALILSYFISIPIGIYSATHSGSFGDRFSSTILFMLYSLPNFWIATLAIIFLCNPDNLMIFPPSNLHSIDYSESWSFLDKTWDTLKHITLPMLIYTYGSFAFTSRLMRGSMLEVVRQDYIRTARAKGLSEKVVIYKHALRNSLIPIITLLAGLLPGLLGGSFIVESIFGIPGIGQLGFQALVERDYPIIMAELVLGSVLTLLGVLLSDLLYTVVDPRIAYAKKSS